MTVTGLPHKIPDSPLYLFVGIDRTSKFAVIQLVDKADRRTAWEFLEHLLKAVPYRIHTILTDNGIQFADQPRNRNTAWSRQMRFDMICEAKDIEHRLTKPNHPWTNGQVERMNRTIKETTVKRFHYESHDQLRTHLADFMAAYNFAAAQDAERSHALRIHRQDLDVRAKSVHRRPDPPDDGTKHLGAAPLPAWSQEQPVVPRLEFAFEEVVMLGQAIPVGETPLGKRNIIPIIGGSFEGPGSRARSLPAAGTGN